MIAIRALAILAAITLTACEEPFGWGRETVDGEWIYQAGSARINGVQCDVAGLRLLLDQDGNDFAGVVSSGSLACTETIFPDDTTELSVDTVVRRSMDGLPVTAGRLDGSKISFQIGAAALEHDGEIVGRSMSGNVVFSGSWIGYGLPTIGGSFAASRVKTEEEE